MRTDARTYIRDTMKIAVPIMVQNGISSFVNMLDNIMVGRIGTDPMSAVAIVNQLVFVFNLTIFGGLSGIGIFTAQYHGKNDEEGVRHTFRLMVLLSLLLAAGGLLVLTLFREPLIRLYLTEDGGIGSTEQTLVQAVKYLSVLYLSFIPFALTQAYSSALRCTGDTVTPMRAGILAMLVNLAGNYILIYGKLGFPAMGVQGAAAATVIARLVECGYLAVRTHRSADRHPFICGAYRSLYVPGSLVAGCAVKGTPLLLNEALWSLGNAALVQLYSTLGLSVVAAFNISSTINNVFNVSFLVLGSAIGIRIGQQLGAGETETAADDALLLTRFSIVVCTGIGIVLFLAAPLFPRLYNTSDEIRALAAGLIRISAVFMPVYTCCNAEYFIIRSGGKTFITFLFDSVFCWTVSIPFLYGLLHMTQLPVLAMFFLVQAADLLKLIVGMVLVRKGIWIHDITKTV